LLSAECYSWVLQGYYEGSKREEIAVIAAIAAIAVIGSGEECQGTAFRLIAEC